MARLGRETEIIVESLEKLISGDLLEIKSPDYLYDHNSEKRREVDVSIKGKIGSHTILVVIECRNRKGVQDVTWIEQLASKKNGINANKMIALSTSSFSTTAKKLAENNGIELRFLKDFDPNEVVDWLSKITVEFIDQRFDIVAMTMRVSDATKREKIELTPISETDLKRHSSINSKDPIFIVESTGKRFSMNDIISNADRQNDNILFRDIQPNAQPIEQRIQLDLSDPSNTLRVEIEGKLCHILEMDITAKVWQKISDIPVTRARRYMSEEENYAEWFDYSWTDTDDKEVIISFQRDMKTEGGAVEVHVEKVQYTPNQYQPPS